MRKVDLVGQRFNKLVVEAREGTRVYPNNSKVATWLCQCDCGKKRIVSTNELKCNQVRSCGCLHEGLVVKNKTEYKSWENMMGRCYNPKHCSYKTHGARGIQVCERWHKFRGFFEDMGKKPDTGYSIDRIDNDGHYTKENCRWATAKQQSNNKRSNVILEHNGQKMTCTQWAEALGTSRAVVFGRLKHGFTVEETLTLPVNHKQRRGCKNSFGSLLKPNAGRHQDVESICPELETGVVA